MRAVDLRLLLLAGALCCLARSVPSSSAYDITLQCNGTVFINSTFSSPTVSFGYYSEAYYSEASVYPCTFTFINADPSHALLFRVPYWPDDESLLELYDGLSTDTPLVSYITRRRSSEPDWMGSSSISNNVESVDVKDYLARNSSISLRFSVPECNYNCISYGFAVDIFDVLQQPLCTPLQELSATRWQGAPYSVYGSGSTASVSVYDPYYGPVYSMSPQNLNCAWRITANDGERAAMYPTINVYRQFAQLAPGDMMYVYDGPDTSYPLLATYRSTPQYIQNRDHFYLIGSGQYLTVTYNTTESVRQSVVDVGFTYFSVAGPHYCTEGPDAVVNITLQPPNVGTDPYVVYNVYPTLIMDPQTQECHTKLDYSPINSTCGWRVTTSDPANVVVVVVDYPSGWLLEEGDYVSIYDGPEMDESRLLSRYSSYAPTNPIFSTNNSVYIYYHTGPTSRSAFNLSVFEINLFPISCGPDSVIVLNETTLPTYNYWLTNVNQFTTYTNELFKNARYLPNNVCTFKLHAPPGQIFKIGDIFTQFYTGSPNDYVEIIDEQGRVSGQISAGMNPHCGFYSCDTMGYNLEYRFITGDVQYPQQINSQGFRNTDVQLYTDWDTLCDPTQVYDATDLATAGGSGIFIFTNEYLGVDSSTSTTEPTTPGSSPVALPHADFQPYPTNLQCSWSFSASPGMVLEIEIILISMAQNRQNDTVFIYDGADASAAVLVSPYDGITYAGRFLQERYYTTGTELFITFNSDAYLSDNQFGFRAIVRESPPPSYCNDDITIEMTDVETLSGQIKWPTSAPYFLGRNMNCQWHLSVTGPESSGLGSFNNPRLRFFLSSPVEESSTSMSHIFNYDYIQWFVGVSEVNPDTQVPGAYFGSNAGGPGSSVDTLWGTEVMVTLNTGQYTGKLEGFTLSWEVVEGIVLPETCGLEVSSESSPFVGSTPSTYGPFDDGGFKRVRVGTDWQPFFSNWADPSYATSNVRMPPDYSCEWSFYCENYDNRPCRFLIQMRNNLFVSPVDEYITVEELGNGASGEVTSTFSDYPWLAKSWSGFDNDCAFALLTQTDRIRIQFNSYSGSGSIGEPPVGFTMRIKAIEAPLVQPNGIVRELTPRNSWLNVLNPFYPAEFQHIAPNKYPNNANITWRLNAPVEDWVIVVDYICFISDEPCVPYEHHTMANLVETEPPMYEELDEVTPKFTMPSFGNVELPADSFTGYVWYPYPSYPYLGRWQLTFYDGPDTSAPVYRVVTSQDYDSNGFRSFASTSSSVFVTFTSDGDYSNADPGWFMNWLARPALQCTEMQEVYVEPHVISYEPTFIAFPLNRYQYWDLRSYYTTYTNELDADVHLGLGPFRYQRGETCTWRIYSQTGSVMMLKLKEIDIHIGDEIRFYLGSIAPENLYAVWDYYTYDERFGDYATLVTPCNEVFVEFVSLSGAANPLDTSNGGGFSITAQEYVMGLTPQSNPWSTDCFNPTGRVCEGNFVIDPTDSTEGPSVYDRIRLCSVIDGSLAIYPEPYNGGEFEGFADYEFPNLEIVTGDLEIGQQTDDSSRFEETFRSNYVRFPSLRSIGGALCMHSINITEVDFSSLEDVHFSLQLGYSLAPATLSLPSLKHAQDIQLWATTVQHLLAPQLVDVSSIDIDHNNDLLTLDLTSLRYATDIRINMNEGLEVVYLTSLAEIEYGFYLFNSDVLTLDMPNLRYIYNTWYDDCHFGGGLRVAQKLATDEVLSRAVAGTQAGEGDNAGEAIWSNADPYYYQYSGNSYCLNWFDQYTIAIVNNPRLQTINIPLLEVAPFSITIVGSYHLTVLNLTSLVSADHFELTHGQLATLELPALQWAGYIGLSRLYDVDTVSLPVLRGISHPIRDPSPHLLGFLGAEPYYRDNFPAGYHESRSGWGPLYDPSYSFYEDALPYESYTSVSQNPFYASRAGIQLINTGVEQLIAPQLKAFSEIGLAQNPYLEILEICSIEHFGAVGAVSNPSLSCGSLQNLFADSVSPSETGCSWDIFGTFGCQYNVDCFVNVTECGYTTSCIQRTIDECIGNHNNTVVIPEGQFVCDLELIIKRKAVHLRGAGMGLTVINCTGDSHRALTIVDVPRKLELKVDDITFEGGVVQDYGGVVLIDNAFPTIRRCGLGGGKAPQGGCVHVMNGGVPKVQKCFIDRCEATGIGGGINVFEGAITVEDSEIHHCLTPGSGGCVAIRRGSERCSFTRCQLHDCTGGQGGGVFTDVDTDIIDTEVHHNHGTLNGGGLSGITDPLEVRPDAHVTCQRCHFHDNTARHGGGCYLRSVHLALQDSHWHDHKADGGDGGAFNAGCACAPQDSEATTPGPGGVCDYAISVTNSTVNGGSANNGGIFALTDMSLYIDDKSDMSDNLALLNGGAVAAINSNLSFPYGARFLQNKAGNGAAIYALNCYVTATNMLFAQNQATSGGAVYLLGGHGTIANSTFEFNTAEDGGALFAYKAYLDLSGTSLYGNNAQYSSPLNSAGAAAANAARGGAAFLTYDPSGFEPNIVGVTFENNIADVGGAYYLCISGCSGNGTTEKLLRTRDANAEGFLATAAQLINNGRVGSSRAVSTRTIPTANTFINNTARFYGPTAASDPVGFEWIEAPHAQVRSGEPISDTGNLVVMVLDVFNQAVTSGPPNVLVLGTTNQLTVFGQTSVLANTSGIGTFLGVSIVANQPSAIGANHIFTLDNVLFDGNHAETTLELVPCADGQVFTPSEQGYGRVCRYCVAGSIPNGNTPSDGCDLCPAGTFGAPGAAACQVCPPDTYTPSAGASTCASCTVVNQDGVSRSNASSCNQAIIDNGSTAGVTFQNVGVPLLIIFLLIIAAIIIGAILLWRLAQKKTMQKYMIPDDATVRAGGDSLLQQQARAMILARSTSRIGGGLYADIFKAKYNNRYIALKVLRADVTGYEGAQAEFRREAVALSRVTEYHHPAVVELFFFCEFNPMCLGEEFAPNGTLKALLASGKKLPTHEKIRLVTETAAAMVVVHGADVVHLDLKTDNLLLAEKNHIKLADFGISRLVAQRNEGPTQLEIASANSAQFHNQFMNQALNSNSSFGSTSSAVPMSPFASFSSTTASEDVAFTVQYVDPARVTGKVNDDMGLRRADVFTFGGVMYAVWTQQEPYAGEDARALLDELRRNPNKRPEPIQNCHVCYDNLLRRCWGPPNERPTMLECFDILNRCFEDHFGMSLDPDYADLSKIRAPTELASTGDVTMRVSPSEFNSFTSGGPPNPAASMEYMSPLGVNTQASLNMHNQAYNSQTQYTSFQGSTMASAQGNPFMQSAVVMPGPAPGPGGARPSSTATTAPQGSMRPQSGQFDTTMRVSASPGQASYLGSVEGAGVAMSPHGSMQYGSQQGGNNNNAYMSASQFNTMLSPSPMQGSPMTQSPMQSAQYGPSQQFGTVAPPPPAGTANFATVAPGPPPGGMSSQFGTVAPPPPGTSTQFGTVAPPPPGTSTQFGTMAPPPPAGPPPGMTSNFNTVAPPPPSGASNFATVAPPPPSAQFGTVAPPPPSAQFATVAPPPPSSAPINGDTTVRIPQ